MGCRSCGQKYRKNKTSNTESVSNGTQPNYRTRSGRRSVVTSKTQQPVETVPEPILESASDSNE